MNKFTGLPAAPPPSLAVATGHVDLALVAVALDDDLAGG
jgi:hypothetical protein